LPHAPVTTSHGLFWGPVRQSGPRQAFEGREEAEEKGEEKAEEGESRCYSAYSITCALLRQSTVSVLDVKSEAVFESNLLQTPAANTLTGQRAGAEEEED